MDVIISHRTAFFFWRQFPGGASSLKRVARTRAMTQPGVLTEELLGELASLGIVPTEQQPVDFLYAGQEHRRRSPRIRPHVMGRDLPAGSLLRVAPHVLVVCPELCFIELGEDESFARLVHRGCEFCGTYYLDAEYGRPHEREGRSSLTSTAALAKYLGTCAPRVVPKAARSALAYVLDGSASPRETTLALLLSLPHRLGGFGLPAPVLNHVVELDAEARRLYPHATCRCDLYWPDAAFALEYQGEEAHWDRYSADIARTAALQAAGVDVLALTKAQLADAKAFTTVTGAVAAKLGRTLRVRREDFVLRHEELREAFGLR